MHNFVILSVPYNWQHLSSNKQDGELECHVKESDSRKVVFYSGAKCGTGEEPGDGGGGGG